MACSNPSFAVDYGVNPDTGKHVIKFLPKRVDVTLESLISKYGDDLLSIPCGKCPSCKKTKADNWAVRCYLESLGHEENCFITLTYDDEHNPITLVKEDVSNFLKKLRNRGLKFKFFCAGEYGSTFQRPHYHLILFGYIPNDLVLIGSSGDNKLYSSKFLESIWEKGFVSIGLCSPSSICYTTQYCCKKIGSASSSDSLEKEFILMSRRPGLGADWLSSHLQDLSVNKDKLYLGEFGVKHYSRYILDLLKSVDPLAYEEVVNSRLDFFKVNKRDKLLSSGLSHSELYVLEKQEDIENAKRKKKRNF